MRRRRFRIGAAPALACLALTGPAAHATSQGPVADGPYVGTLPCADSMRSTQLDWLRR